MDDMIEINTADEEEIAKGLILLGVDHFGDNAFQNLIQSILSQRDISPFTGWVDFLNRLGDDFEFLPSLSGRCFTINGQNSLLVASKDLESPMP